MRRLKTLCVTLLVLAFTSDFAAGEDLEAQNVDNAQVENDGNYEGKLQVCADAVIQVQSVYVYCDSPGTFYYGSGKYRNSQTCQPGDKATVQVDFRIADDETIQKYGNRALIDIVATGGVNTEDVVVYDSADLCSLSSLQKKSRSTCPYNGYFLVKTHFYWGSSDESETFEPTITVGFKSSAKKNVYDFGGANTDLCDGNLFADWSENTRVKRVKYANALGSFFKTFGVLVVTIVLIGAFALFHFKRPKNYDEAKADLIFSKRNFMTRVSNKLRRPRDTTRDLSIHEGDEFDFQKIQTAGNRDLLDL